MGSLTFSTEPRALEPRFSANTRFSGDESPRHSESEGELSEIGDDWILDDRDGASDAEAGLAPVDEDDEVALDKFRGLTVAFKDLQYTVRDSSKRSQKICLLHKVSGMLHPGQMTALMGPSGSSKTTLLDVLAGRKTVGDIKGSVRFGGSKVSRPFLRRYTGYVEQFDTLLDNLTVREMLLYTAEMMNPQSQPYAEKAARVDLVMSQLALLSCRSVRIGSALARGISGGQAKRVNIGIALVTNTRVLFMDEPTSGLDSYTANEVMTVVKGLVQGGMTICATIHSPTPFCFGLFDRIMILLRGHLIYAGANGQDAVQFFETTNPEYRFVRDFTDPQYLGPRIVDKLVLGLLIMSLYWKAAETITPISATNVGAVLFMVSILPGFAATTYIPSLVLERVLYYRERNDGMYRSITYLLAKMTEELAAALISSLIFSFLVFFPLKLAGSFGLFFCAYYLTTIIGIVLAYVIAALSPTMEVANGALPAYVVTLLFFVGLLIRADNQPRYWHCWSAHMNNQFDEHNIIVILDYRILNFYSVEGDNKWVQLGYEAIFFVVFFLFAWAALSFVKHQKR
ncbi:hypothetical protein WJX73_010576 [Symbiochloris irregularis]|uniref:ABC transporter domain-containing protein n=1 Tax=Symbiochloris irregularis TaxID=706552 RepID=A0AAW1PIZ7_9CHLO